MKTTFVILAAILLSGCGYFLSNPQQVERLEEDAVDIGEVVIDAIENKPATPKPEAPQAGDKNAST
jgi:outer membrane lipopolysaccharide assembly protein LptE/RlpB